MGKKIRILKKTEMRVISGEMAILDFESGKFFLLNVTADEIWKMIQMGIMPDKIVEQLSNNYEIGMAECDKVVEGFLFSLEEEGLIAVS